jgi:hypothetical protein
VKKRSYQVRACAIKKPKQVQVNGKKYNHWKWNAKSFAAMIKLAKKFIWKKITITLK